MDNLGHRSMIGHLAEDLGWLEQHSREQGAGYGDVPRNAEWAALTLELRVAAALVRNCLGPFLDGQVPPPLHIAVVGGAGTGKSTVANLLSGAQAAEANPQAGFTRHPIVYTNQTGPLSWTGYLGFLGPLQRAPQESPASLDADVYQVRRVPADTTSFDLLKDFVVWDCPDMTTFAASGVPVEGLRTPGYITRLLEVSALADVLVYVASDERYNDEVPTQFLRLLLTTGKPVVVCLTKMRESEAEALIDHFKKSVLKGLPGGVVGIVAIPFLTAEQLSDPARKAAQHRIPVINQVAVLGGNATEARKRTVLHALRYLSAAQDRLMSVAKDDVEALQRWRVLVQNGQIEFDQRYRREYLSTEKYRGFDQALVRLLELLELPGVGKVVGGALWVLRTPYRLVRGILGKAMKRPEAGSLPEYPVLEDSLSGWIDLLRKEAARQSGSHPLWEHVAQGFAGGGLAERIKERYLQGYRAFQLALAEETDRTARAIYEQLEKNPGVLNTLRGSKLAMDVAAVGAAVATGGIGLHDLILVPLAASVSHQLIELMGKSYVDGQRELTRQRQGMLMTQYISGPVSEWMAQWPATGGSAFERLQLALRRIPEVLHQVSQSVAAKGTA